MRPAPKLLALACSAIPFALAARAQDAPPAGAPQPAAEAAPIDRLFPPERHTHDRRLNRPARKTDTHASWDPPVDPIEWLQRRNELTERIRLAAGMWPYPGAATDLVGHGEIDCGEYTIQKVLFQGHFFGFVPGNIYWPNGGDEKKPVVICVPDHDLDARLTERSPEAAQRLLDSGAEKNLQAAKYPMQARCTQLARMGCIVLTFDAPGFGEYLDYDHNQAFAMPELVLRAQNVYELQFWNLFMGLNHLWNMDGTDRERVGFVGGGTGASSALFVSAVEKRVTATFLAGLVPNRSQGECVCENPSNLRVGTSDLEFAAAIAPRALALAVPESTPEEIEQELRAPLKKHWRVQGDADDVDVLSFPVSEEAFDLRAREAMYAFMNEHLKLGIEGPITEQDFAPIPPKDLRVYDDTHGFPPQARSAKGVYEVFTDQCDSDLELLFVSEDPHRVRVFRGVMYEALRLLLDTRLPGPNEVEAREIATETLPGRTIHKLTLSRARAGEEIPTLLVMPDAWNGTLVVGVSGAGKSEFFQPGRTASSLASALRVVDAGAAFLAPDVLLTGEYRDGIDMTARLPIDPERNARDVGFTWAYNRTLVAERVNDVLTAVAYARSLDGVRRVNLLGTGAAGPWVLMARALMGQIDSVDSTVERTAAQWSWTYEHVHSFNDENFLPGALRYGGVSYFAGLIAPAELRFAAGPEEGAPIVIPELVMKAYRSLDATSKVGSVGNRRYGELVDWVAEAAPPDEPQREN